MEDITMRTPESVPDEPLVDAARLTQQTRDRLVFMEIMMDKDDVPALLADVASALTRANS